QTPRSPAPCSRADQEAHPPPTPPAPCLQHTTPRQPPGPQTSAFPYRLPGRQLASPGSPHADGIPSHRTAPSEQTTPRPTPGDSPAIPALPGYGNPDGAHPPGGPPGLLPPLRPSHS